MNNLNICEQMEPGASFTLWHQGTLWGMIRALTGSIYATHALFSQCKQESLKLWIIKPKFSASPFIHSSVHPFFLAFLHPLLHPYTHLFIPAFIYPYIHSFLHAYICRLWSHSSSQKNNYKEKQIMYKSHKSHFWEKSVMLLNNSAKLSVLLQSHRTQFTRQIRFISSWLREIRC